MELNDKTGLMVTGQSRCMWNVATISLHFAVLSGFRGRLGPKKAILGHKMRNFGRAPPDVAPRLGVPPVSFGVKLGEGTT